MMDANPISKACIAGSITILTVAGMLAFETTVSSRAACSVSASARNQAKSSDYRHDFPSLFTPSELPAFDASPGPDAVAAELLEIRRLVNGSALFGTEFDGFETNGVSVPENDELIGEQLRRLSQGTTEEMR